MVTGRDFLVFLLPFLVLRTLGGAQPGRAWAARPFLFLRKRKGKFGLKMIVGALLYVVFSTPGGSDRPPPDCPPGHH